MVSEKYYLVVNILFIKEERKIVDEETNTEIDILSISGKKTIFRREIQEWLLNPIKKLVDEDKNEFTNDYRYKPFRYSIFALFGLFAYVEKIELYRGNGIQNDRCSTQRLIDGLKRIFTNLDRYEDIDIRDILKKTRHNLMHQAMIGDDVLLNLGISSNGTDVDFDSEIGFHNAINITSEGATQEIRINPILMYEQIQSDFDSYLLLIDTDEDIKEKFILFFNNVYEYEIQIISE